MAVTATPALPQTPRSYKLQLVNANGTTAQALTAGGANGTKVTGLIATNTDSGAAYALTVSILRSATTYAQATVNVPLSSGNTAAAPAVNLMSPSNWPGLPIDSDGNPYFFLESTDTLQVASGTTITSPKLVSITAVAADF